MKIVADVRKSLFDFKINDDYKQETIIPKRLMFDTEATSHIIKDVKKFKKCNKTFQPEKHYIELDDRTKISGIALKRGNAKVCLLDVDGNYMTVKLKKVLYIPSYPQAISLDCNYE